MNSTTQTTDRASDQLMDEYLDAKNRILWELLQTQTHTVLTYVPFTTASVASPQPSK